MPAYCAFRSALWQVLVSLVATLWMAWEVLAALAGANPLVRAEYGVALVVFFALCTGVHYRRWRAAQQAPPQTAWQRA